MKVSKFVLIVISLSLVFPSCITYMHSEKIKRKYKPDKEFTKHYKVDTNSIVGREGEVNVFQGVYLGEGEKKGVNYYNFQFSGMLNGENRVLDMYLETDTASFPIVHEVEKVQQGVPAYLFMNTSCSYGTRFTLLYGLFSPFSEDASIEPFLDFIGQNKTQISDTTFLISLYYPIGACSPSNIVTNIYTKENDGNFSLKQFREKEYTPNDCFSLQYVTRNRRKKVLSQMLYPLTVLSDIAIFPFQIFVLIDIKRNGIW